MLHGESLLSSHPFWEPYNMDPCFLILPLSWAERFSFLLDGVPQFYTLIFQLSCTGTVWISLGCTLYNTQACHNSDMSFVLWTVSLHSHQRCKLYYPSIPLTLVVTLVLCHVCSPPPNPLQKYTCTFYLIQACCSSSDVSFVICTDSLQDVKANKRGQLSPTTTPSERVKIKKYRVFKGITEHPL